MRTIQTISRVALAAIAFAGGISVFGDVVPIEAPQYPQYVQYPDSPPVAPGVEAPATLLTGDQLDNLLAPVALYPDPLLAEMFPAATYPQDIATAQQWLQATPNPSEDAIDAQPWDDSIKAIMHYPSVLQYMAQNMDWTQTLGAAFLNQQQDVMDSVQRLRALAQYQQNLQANADQQIVIDNGDIRIEPVNPDLLYVPVYDPNVAYTQACTINYGVGFPIGFWCDNDFDWGGNFIIAGGGWYQRWNHPADWDRHPPAWGVHHPQNAPPAGRWNRRPGEPLPRVSTIGITRLGLNHPRTIGPARSGTPARGGGATPRTPQARGPEVKTPLGSKPGTPPAAGRNVFGSEEPRQDVNQEQERGKTSESAGRPAAGAGKKPVETPHPAAPQEAPHPVVPARPVVPERPQPAPRIETPRAPAPEVRAPAPEIRAPAPEVRAPAPAFRALRRPRFGHLNPRRVWKHPRLHGRNSPAAATPRKRTRKVRAAIRPCISNTSVVTE